MTDETQDRDPFADDPLVKRAREGIAVESNLAGSPVWLAILEAAQADELEAMRDLADIPATDVNGIIACKIRIFAARAVPGYVLAKIDEGKMAEDSIRYEESNEG